MDSVLTSGSSNPGSSLGQGHCVVFLGEDSVSLHPGVQIGTSEFNAGDGPVMD